jgi:hypothetical protein
MDNTKEVFGGIQTSEMLALLKYLFELTDCLPQKQKEEFLRSPAHLEMKHLISMLEHWELDSFS